MSELDVFVSDRRVGVLREDVATGLIDFAYLSDVPDDLAVSLVMPPSASAEQYCEFNGLPPPFEVSLPEGMLVEAIQKRFGQHLDLGSDFALLRLVGPHTSGRVSFGGPLAQDPELERQIVAAARSQTALARLAEILRASPQMFGISGVMPKLTVANGERLSMAWPVGCGAIIKFDPPNYTGASLVEYACLKACEAVGLDVPTLELTPDMSAIIVARFDIAADRRRLGFEDACALSGLRRAGKYGGSIEHLFDMIRAFVHPDDQETDRRALLKLAIMNDVLRNGDAHLKNFGLLYGDVFRPRLAPAYDVLTTPVWIHADTPALPILKTDRDSGRWLDAQGMEQLASVAALPGIDLAQMYAECAEAARESMAKTLANCQPSPQRQALERALTIVAADAP